MRRIVLFLLAISVILPASVPTYAQDGGEAKLYRSEALGVSFQHPTDWQISEQLATRTITAASKADSDAVTAGKPPTGLIFTVTMSTFQRIGAAGLDDFGPVLRNIVQSADAEPKAIKIGDAVGLAIDTASETQGVASRTAILSIGKRRVAVVRGVSTPKAWFGRAADQFEKLMVSLVFDPPQLRDDLDAFGRVLWQLPAEKLTAAQDIGVSADGASLFVTDQQSGIWRIGATGILNEQTKPDGPGAFAGIGVMADGAQYVADPVNHTIWKITAGKAERFIGGQSGEDNGQFGEKSPQRFAFGPRGFVYVVDENAKGLRVQVFTPEGKWSNTWDLSGIQSTAVENPLISSDDAGNIYLVGNNTEGIIKLSNAGKVLVKNLGKDDLTDLKPLVMIADRTESLYIATADQGILKLDPSGNLIGLVGEPYDESSAPKPGQIGKPVAMTLFDGGKLLYVVDGGKYPQVVAFGLHGNHGVNVLSGTRDAGPIDYNRTVTGEVNATTFMDVYTLKARYGDVISITAKQDSGSQLDPYVDLISPRGTRLAASDDAKGLDLGPVDARIQSYHVQVDGTFTIRVTRFGRETTNAVGTYSLIVTLEKSITPGTRIAPSATFTPSITPIPPTATDTPTPTATFTETPTKTATNTATPIPTRTKRPTLTPSNTSTPSPTRTPRPSLTPTHTPTIKPSATLTVVPSATQ